MSRRQLERGRAVRGMVTEQGIVPLDSGVPDDDDCSILHIDMDAFFTGVEQLRHPETGGRPVIVGGTGPRGVVSAANYQAREYGVHSAMPMSRALRLCRDAVVFPPDGAAYRRVSAAVMDILRSVTPEIEPLSVDEAFLDVAGARRRLGGPVRVAELIRSRVRAEQGLTCSVGVAATKFVAKLASTRCKPDGLLLIPTAHVTAFVHPLPVGALWGVGEKTEQTLKRLGLRTVGDVARTPPEMLRHELGQALGTHLAELSWGRDPRPVSPQSVDKSIGAEETFDTDVFDTEVIHRELLRLVEKVARRLRESRQVGRTVVVKLRRGDFSTITRSRTLTEHTDVAREVFAAARELYAASGLHGVPLRLVGVRVEGLEAQERVHRQLAFDEPDSDWRAAEQVMDAVARKFGANMIGPAVLAAREEDKG
ncbi:DNA polymerase IV [Nocardiopsis ansamitocini]|uniref:DNA polymerase IV n=1 Tax=Nocardiopsis ansamitocini TaxID=1670832 RepID=A0A9W6P2F8_9ACTN|nr:DNA polymerase IV [Nocardiopsis ansamitocini]GLU45989.1 DNA polymerase IV [Nocardiopsis ansamitocini]